MKIQRRQIRARLAALLLGLALMVLLASCGGGRRPKASEGSAVWMAEASAPLSASDLSTLESIGVEGLFGEGAVLQWNGESPRLTERARLALPPRTPITLVLRGSWHDGLDGEAMAKSLAEEVRRVSMEADAAGLVAAGFHFEFDATGQLESYGRTLDRLRAELPRDLRVSAGVRRAWIEDDGLPILADGVDFLVAWLYGQRPQELRQEGWQDEAWDLRQVDLSLRRLERLKAPYLVGVVTLGSTLLLDSSRNVRDLRPGGPLRPLVRHPSLRLDHGFVLSGMDCRRYDFRAEGDFTIEGGSGSDDWKVKKGNRLRSLALGATRLREYRLLLPALDLRHRLGDLFYHLPAAEDRLSVGLDGFRQALGPMPADGRLAVELEEVSRLGGSLMLRAKLRNPGIEATEIAFVDRNYLELRTLSGRFGRIDPGDFQRYQLLRRGADGSDRPSLRNADVLRLFEPVVDPGAEVLSGQLEVVGGRGAGDILWQANYLLGDGSELHQTSGDEDEEGAVVQ